MKKLCALNLNFTLKQQTCRDAAGLDLSPLHLTLNLCSISTGKVTMTSNTTLLSWHVQRVILAEREVVLQSVEASYCYCKSINLNRSWNKQIRVRGNCSFATSICLKKVHELVKLWKVWRSNQSFDQHQRTFKEVRTLDPTPLRLGESWCQEPVRNI